MGNQYLEYRSNYLLFGVLLFCFALIGGISISALPLKVSLPIVSLVLLAALIPIFLEKTYLLLLIFIGIIPFLLLVPMFEEGFSILIIPGFLILSLWYVNLTLKKESIIITPYYKYLIAFFCAILISTILGKDIKISFLALRSYVMIFLVFFLIVNLIKTPQHLIQAGWVIIITMAILAFFVLLDQWNLIGFAINYPLSYHELHRSRVGLSDPNFTSLMLSIAIPFTFYFLFIYKNIIQRIILIILLSLFIMAIILTYSIGGLIGLLSIFFLVIFFMKGIKTGRKISIFITVMLILCAGFFLLPESYKARVQDKYEVARTKEFAYWGSTRGAALIGGLNVIINNPILGVGPENHGFEALKYYPIIRARGWGLHRGATPHNLYISITGESGLIGLFTFVLLIFVIIKGLRKSINKLEDLSETKILFLGQGFIVSIIAFLIQSIFLDTQRHKYLWILLGLIVSFTVIANQIEKESNESIDHT